ncbi:tRNA uridine-5-carboxymethylaminomethyl(34) synthesis GTPase MnmE [Primorskyibacter sp. S87]|uniref:tRNA uridine-5-carboxymethylaminomethyl(34) synthesis GTPase MnmE n=1 Tax=Primorskyibacter sp. S87 TaxID=3415126 RepID=UPI003C7C3C8C
MDTVFALASAPGKAGVAVVRISGPKARSAACTLSSRDLPERGMTYASLHDRHGGFLDDALILTFLAPASFTGEDVVELQVHGSIASINAILQTLSGLDDLRLAEPGEFTRRALENGKLDLAQVEGLADLIEAETEAQRKQAQAVLGGRLGDLAEVWRRDLIRAASLIEAVIDFADEEVPTDVGEEVSALLEFVLVDLNGQIKGISVSERIRSGFEVAIVGSPNVGKSTLLNALAGRDAAITSEVAGTTRDVIEVRMDLAGLPVTLLDTAGLRETEDSVERIGISRARDRAKAADLRVFLAEAGETFDVTPEEGDIWLLPKGDLRLDKNGAISGKSGFGVEELILKITDELSERSARSSIATRERHRVAMQRALVRLEGARNLLGHGPEQYDIVAEEIRSAIRALEMLVGRIDVENLLDEIFASFCLGK